MKIKKLKIFIVAVITSGLIIQNSFFVYAEETTSTPVLESTPAPEVTSVETPALSVETATSVPEIIPEETPDIPTLQIEPAPVSLATPTTEVTTPEISTATTTEASTVEPYVTTAEEQSATSSVTEPTIPVEPAILAQDQPEISVDNGIVFEDASSTPQIFRGSFEERKIPTKIGKEAEEKDGKPTPKFSQIFYRDQNNNEIQITEDGYDNTQYQARGGFAVWKGYPTIDQGHAEIFLYNLENKERNQISINHSSNDDPILTDDGQVVWRGWDPALGTWNIYYYNGRETQRISNTKEGAIWPSISGDVITWQEKNSGVWQIMAYSISTHRPWLVTGDGFDNEHPQTDGRNIVWQKKNAEGLHDIFIYDLKTERLWQLTKDPKDEVLPSISSKNKKIAWFKQNTETFDFDEVSWDPNKVEELGSKKPKAIENQVAENPPDTLSNSNAPPNNSIPVSSESLESNAVPIETASTTSQISVVIESATATPQNAPLDLAGAASESLSPTSSVSLVEPPPPPPSEISIPTEVAPQPETKIQIPIEPTPAPTSETSEVSSPTQ